MWAPIKKEDHPKAVFFIRRQNNTGSSLVVACLLRVPGYHTHRRIAYIQLQLYGSFSEFARRISPDCNTKVWRISI